MPSYQKRPPAGDGTGDAEMADGVVTRVVDAAVAEGQADGEGVRDGAPVVEVPAPHP